jgi:hypothetical protein
MVTKWKKRDGIELTWKETLESMCRYYGTFCGRWHSNAFWKKTQESLPSLTEEQCREAIIKIENEADADLAYWQVYQ